MRSPATFVSTLALTVSLFGNALVYVVARNSGERRAEVAANARRELRLESSRGRRDLCVQIQQLRTQNRTEAAFDYKQARRDALRDFGQLDRSLRLLKLERTAEIVQAAEEQRDQRIASAKEHLDQRLKSNKPEPCPVVQPNKEKP